MEKRRQAEFLTTCECLNRKNPSQQLTPCVIATRDLLFLQDVFAIIMLFKQVKTMKNVSKELFTSKIKKNRRGREEN